MRGVSQTETPLDRDPPNPLWTDKYMWKHNFHKLRLRAIISRISGYNSKLKLSVNTHLSLLSVHNAQSLHGYQFLTKCVAKIASLIVSLSARNESRWIIFRGHYYLALIMYVNISIEIVVNCLNLKNNIERQQYFLCCHWNPSFGLLVTSALVSKPGWISRLPASSPARNGFLRFTSGVTPADLLTASMTA